MVVHGVQYSAIVFTMFGDSSALSITFVGDLIEATVELFSSDETLRLI